MTIASTASLDCVRGSHKSRRRTLWVASLLSLFLAMVVVILGAFTRLSDAGLGCPDWPGCYGHLMWPKTTEQVAIAEARFPESPVEHDKTWPEMVHRYFAGFLGLAILGIACAAWSVRKKEPHIPIGLPFALVILVLIQAAFGMWTVTLKLWPQVVTAHLLGGFATASGLWLLALRLWPLNLHAAVAPALRYFSLVALMAVIVQITLGGWTSSNYAAIACADLPKCHGVWIPPADYAQGFNIFQKVGPNYLGGLLDNHARTAIHFSHRVGALLVTLILSALAIALWCHRTFLTRLLSATVFSALVIQVGLGISNVYWVLPLPIAVAHNAFGLVLLLVLVMVNYCLRAGREKNNV